MGVQCHMGPIIPAALVTSQLDSDVITHSHPFILHLLRISQRRFGAFAVLHCWRCYRQTANHYLNKQQQEPRCWPMFDRNWERCPKSHEGEEATAPSIQEGQWQRATTCKPVWVCMLSLAVGGWWAMTSPVASLVLSRNPIPHGDVTIQSLPWMHFWKFSSVKYQKTDQTCFFFWLRTTLCLQIVTHGVRFKRDLLAVFNTA